jgi:hypothetical protein
LRAIWAESPQAILSPEEFCVDHLGKRYPWEAAISDDTVGATKQWAYDLDQAEAMLAKYSEYPASLR